VKWAVHVRRKRTKIKFITHFLVCSPITKFCVSSWNNLFHGRDTLIGSCTAGKTFLHYSVISFVSGKECLKIRIGAPGFERVLYLNACV
jgi:hypothetical protein